MKNGLYAFLSMAGFLFLQYSALAQNAEPSVEGKNMAGIRISSKDAVINNSITYKRFFNPTTAVEGLFSFGDPAALGVLIEKHKPLGGTALTWFWGAGAYAGFSGGRRFGFQGVVGLDFVFPSIPVNLSADWKPELNVSRQFSFEPAAVGISARFIF